MDLKINLISAGSILASMFLTHIESILSVAVLTTALVYNLIKIYHQRKKDN